MTKRDVTFMRIILNAIALLIGFLPAYAAEFSQTGSIARLNGGIMRGDGQKFEDFMAQPSSAGLKVLYLNSGGGSVGDALRIARAIRKARLTTVIDASRAKCESACTGIFTGGTSRHYINSQGLVDGEGGPPRGLGFHEGNNAQPGSARTYSGGATSGMINIYYEMGVGGAAQFTTKSAFNKMYRVSGPTALQSGIATSLSAP
jgi:hypothetical protein